MSSYHTSFSYLNQNSKDNFNLIISHFDSDNGESETGLATESIYTASTDGSRRNLYGTKYTGAQPVRITLIKPNGGEFSVADNRTILKWLTGAQTDSWLDLKIGEAVQYRMFGHVQNVLQYKLDARIVGLIVVFESASPWAFSDLQTVVEEVDGTKDVTIVNESDDLYGYTSVKTTYINDNANGSLTIQNTTTKETTTVNNLAANEVVTLDANQMITSDKSSRSFGNDFNFIFPRLIAGINTLSVTGHGKITFDYYYCIKIGDMATNLNADTDPICNEYGDVEIDVLSWNRIINTPTTLSGYGISDAYPISSVYNKNEVNMKISEVSDEAKSAASLASSLSSDLSKNHYTKIEIDSMLNNFVSDDVYSKSEIDEMLKNIDISGVDVYTKSEIDEKLKSITVAGVDIDDEDLNAMLAEVLI